MSDFTGWINLIRKYIIHELVNVLFVSAVYVTHRLNKLNWYRLLRFMRDIKKREFQTTFRQSRQKLRKRVTN